MAQDGRRRCGEVSLLGATGTQRCGEKEELAEAQGEAEAAQGRGDEAQGEEDAQGLCEGQPPRRLARVPGLRPGDASRDVLALCCLGVLPRSLILRVSLVVIGLASPNR